MTHTMTRTPEKYSFPPLETASTEGLLAIGGDLNPERILSAYRQGIFPWYSAGQPILWWSPNPRAILYPQRARISRSLRRSLRQRGFAITADRYFAGVIRQCTQPRNGKSGTWITPDMEQAYTTLHQMGYAHSIETWQDSKLVGGLYGIAIGKAFFGESMFSQTTDASEAALIGLASLLATQGYHFIDCQVASPHLESLGAESLPRQLFTQQLAQAVNAHISTEAWQLEKQGGQLA